MANQTYLEYELVGGGPVDGNTGHMYELSPDLTFINTTHRRKHVYVLSTEKPEYGKKLYYKYLGVYHV
jgi:predicted proteasome-type protease